MTSEAQRKAGFLLPDQITGHNLIPVCMLIPDDLDYRAAFRGVVKKLTDPWSWQALDKSEYPRQHEAAAYWRGLIHEHLHFGDECAQGAPNVLFDFRDDCVMYYSNDAGSTWQPVPGWATFAGACFVGPTGPQGLPGADGEDGEQGPPGPPGECDCGPDSTPAPPDLGDPDGQRCAIAKAYVEYVREFNDHSLDVIDLGGTVAAIVGAIMVGVGAPIAAAVAYAVVELATDLGTGIIRAAQTPQIWDGLECWVYCNLPDDLVIDDEFRDQFRAHILASGLPPIAFIATCEEGFYTEDLKRRAYAASLSPDPSCAVNCDPCDDGEWCYEFDFTITNGGFAVVPATPWGDWQSGVGWVGTPAGTGVSIRIDRDFASTTITHVESEIVGTANWVVALDDDLIINASGTGIRSWTGTKIATNLRLANSSGSAQGSAVTLIRCLVRGTGTNPFGTDNCT